MDSVATALGVVATPFGVGEPTFFRGAPRRFVGRGQNVLLAHLGATDFGGVLFLQKGLQRTDPGVQAVGLGAEVVVTLFL